MKTLAVILFLLWPSNTEYRVEHRLAWAQFTWDYSSEQWCVDAQRRDADPGEMIGGCWSTLKEAEEGILKK